MQYQQVRFEHLFAMPNKETFKIPPITKLLYEETNNKYYDAFPFPYKEDFLEKAKSIPDNSIKFVAYDPPYSPRQLKECYASLGQVSNWDGTNSMWSKWEAELARICEPCGNVIKFGWNSHLIRPDFEITRILLVNHGSHHNDTIVTVQKKVQTSLPIE